MRRGMVVAGLVVLVGVLLAPAGSLLYESGGPEACANCHEMGRQVELWSGSAHREVKCGACHGDALTMDARVHWTNARRVAEHWMGRIGEEPRLGEGQVLEMMSRCKGCHEQEFAAWQAGPHAATYERLFLDEKHNHTRHLMNDCLRCHGAHAEGAIGDVVAPLDTKGPWRLVREELRGQPAIPCMQCHAVHREGQVLGRKRLEAKMAGRQQETHRPGLGFYDRRSRAGVRAGLLRVPKMEDNGRVLRMSADGRQAVCYQCHAPLAGRQAGSGDDRTPKGVHEGLSCLACHEQHRGTTRASCATCHPRLSNCGRDVETMDTTFANAKSGHNVHWVACADCHAKGVPRRR